MASQRLRWILPPAAFPPCRRHPWLHTIGGDRVGKGAHQCSHQSAPRYHFTRPRWGHRGTQERESVEAVPSRRAPADAAHLGGHRQRRGVQTLAGQHHAGRNIGDIRVRRAAPRLVYLCPLCCSLVVGGIGDVDRLSSIVYAFVAQNVRGAVVVQRTRERGYGVTASGTDAPCPCLVQGCSSG